ncbi:LysE family translocator [Akkermansia glycaniphila]|nr:LysE family translocator [Akkermansia glycaniphila]
MVWELLLFALFFIFSQLSPGPDVALVFRAALSRGFRAGAAVGLGCSAGLVFHAALVCSLGAALLDWTYAPYVCAAAGGWLLFLAWKVYPRRGVSQDAGMEGAAPKESLASFFRDGLVSNVLNPKVTFFLLSLATPLLRRHDEPWFPWVMGLAMVVPAACGWMLWSGLLQFPVLRACYVRHTRGIEMVFAVLLAVFAAGCFVSAAAWSPSVQG